MYVLYITKHEERWVRAAFWEFDSKMSATVGFKIYTPWYLDSHSTIEQWSSLRMCGWECRSCALAGRAPAGGPSRVTEASRAPAPDAARAFQRRAADAQRVKFIRITKTIDLITIFTESITRQTGYWFNFLGLIQSMIHMDSDWFNHRSIQNYFGGFDSFFDSTLFVVYFNN